MAEVGGYQQSDQCIEDKFAYKKVLYPSESEKNKRE